jgi:hypothetical protein
MNSKFYIFSLFSRLYWVVVPLFWKLYPYNFGKHRTNFKYSIGIVTYVDRYRVFFQPLIKNLVNIYPDTEFIIAINGYYNQKIQEQYLSEISNYLKNFKNVKIVSFVEPQSLSKLWNLLIINSSTEKVLILNDDIAISTTFRKHLEQSNVLKSDISIINTSWSHFIITKKIVEKIGWFDERFPGVGNEDQDYECRLVIGNIVLADYKVKGLKNIVFQTKDFSYGNEIEVEQKKYVKKNKTFFDSKWELSETERTGFKYVRIVEKYVRLKRGMDTPKFYSGVFQRVK